MFDAAAAAFGSTWVTDLDFKWAPSSFARSSGARASLLARDTHVQKQRVYRGPFPDLEAPL